MKEEIYNGVKLFKVSNKLEAFKLSQKLIKSENLISRDSEGLCLYNKNDELKYLISYSLFQTILNIVFFDLLDNVSNN